MVRGHAVASYQIRLEVIVRTQFDKKKQRESGEPGRTQGEKKKPIGSILVGQPLAPAMDRRHVSIYNYLMHQRAVDFRFNYFS